MSCCHGRSLRAIQSAADRSLQKVSVTYWFYRQAPDRRIFQVTHLRVGSGDECVSRRQTQVQASGVPFVVGTVEVQRNARPSA
jgi:hypothetical protein